MRRQGVGGATLETGRPDGKALDDTLALCCALPLRVDSLEDYRRDLVAGAGLSSPFEPRVLRCVVAAPAEWIAA